MHRATFTLDADAHAFLLNAGGENKSAFITRLLKEEKRRSLMRAVAAANQEESEDADYQAELALWDALSGDGL